jgi:hypothetical protein
MHLAHPALTSLGKRKGKQKFRNADEARKARELEQEWAKNKAKWDAMLKPVTKKIKTQVTKLSPTIARETPHIPSLNLGITGAENVVSKVKSMTKKRHSKKRGGKKVKTYRV